MPVFEHNGKYGLFIHIPKTGGKSVTEYLKDAGCRISFIDHPPKYRWKANTRYTLKARAAWQVPCELLKEPIDPFIEKSWHHWVVPQHAQGDILESSFKLDKISWIFTMVRDPIGRCVSQYGPPNMKEDFDSWVKGARKQWKKNPYYADNHFRPQVDFILPRCKVFTYPHYHELINYLEAEVGLPKSEFKKIGSSSGPIPTVSPKSERLIKEWYHSDYEFLKNEQFV